jgi:DEAD/DEAH box helicase domain-containing protein
MCRRLKRLCAFYGSKPQFICCSATIANPQDLASRLIEEGLNSSTKTELLKQKNISSSAIRRL